MDRKYIKYKKKYLHLKKKIGGDGGYNCVNYKCVNNTSKDVPQYFSRELCENSCFAPFESKKMLESFFEKESAYHIVDPVLTFALKNKENFDKFIKEEDNIKKTILFINTFQIVYPENVFKKSAAKLDIMNSLGLKTVSHNSINILVQLLKGTNSCVVNDRIIFFEIRRKNFSNVINATNDQNVKKKYSADTDNLFESNIDIVLKSKEYPRLIPSLVKSYDVGTKIHSGITSCETFRFLYFPITILFPIEGMNGHENAVIVDKHKEKIYHYEPNVHENESLNKEIMQYFSKLFPNFKIEFLKDVDCPIGMQSLTQSDTCQSWVLYFGLLRILNPNKPTTRIIKHVSYDSNYTKLVILQFIFYIYSIFSQKINEGLQDIVPIYRDPSLYTIPRNITKKFTLVKKEEYLLEEIEKNTRKIEHLRYMATAEFIKQYLSENDIYLDVICEKNGLVTVKTILTKYIENFYMYLDQRDMARYVTETLSTIMRFYDSVITYDGFSEYYYSMIHDIMYGLKKMYNNPGINTHSEIYIHVEAFLESIKKIDSSVDFWGKIYDYITFDYITEQSMEKTMQKKAARANKIVTREEFNKVIKLQKTESEKFFSELNSYIKQSDHNDLIDALEKINTLLKEQYQTIRNSNTYLPK